MTRKLLKSSALFTSLIAMVTTTPIVFANTSSSSKNATPILTTNTKKTYAQALHSYIKAVVNHSIAIKELNELKKLENSTPSKQILDQESKTTETQKDIDKTKEELQKVNVPEKTNAKTVTIYLADQDGKELASFTEDFPKSGTKLIKAPTHDGYVLIDETQETIILDPSGKLTNEKGDEVQPVFAYKKVNDKKETDSTSSSTQTSTSSNEPYSSNSSNSEKDKLTIASQTTTDSSSETSTSSSTSESTSSSDSNDSSSTENLPEYSSNSTSESSAEQSSDKITKQLPSTNEKGNNAAIWTQGIIAVLVTAVGGFAWFNFKKKSDE